MKKIICLMIAVAMAIGNISFATGTENDFVWTPANGGVVENIKSIKGDASVLKAFGKESLEFTAEASAESAYVAEFSMLIYDFNGVRAVKMSGVNILEIDKNGKITSGLTEILNAELNEWYDFKITVNPEIGTYKIVVEDKEIEGKETFAKLEGIKFICSDCHECGAQTIISDPVVYSMPEEVKVPGKSEITTFIQTQGGAPDYVRERIEDPTGEDRGTITNLKLNGKKWMEGRQNASFSGLAELNVDWYFNDFGAELNTIAARMNNTSGAWSEFLTFRHSDKKIVLGNKNSTDVIGGDYALGQWYNIKIIFDFDNSVYYAYVYDKDMNTVASGSKSMDESFESVAILSIYLGSSTLSGAARTSSLYVDNYYYRPVAEGITVKTAPFNGEKNVECDEDIKVEISNIIDKESLKTMTVTLNGEEVADKTEQISPEELKISFNEDFLPDTEYKVEILGLKDIFGKVIPVGIKFKTAKNLEYGELSVVDGSGVSASVKTEKAADIYAVIYDENGKMLDYEVNNIPENGKITAEVSGEYDSFAGYAWDSDMNILTPAKKSRHEMFDYSEPCEITVSKVDYDNDIVKISGTANRGAAIILKDADGEIIAIREATAFSNGYFETQFKTDYYGKVTLFINTQDGEGIKELGDITLYSAEQLVDIVDKFNPGEDYIPEYKSLIEEYADFFGFKPEEYKKVSAEDFEALMSKKEGRYEEISDVTDAYNYALAVGLFNASENGEEARKLLERYSKTYGLFETETFGYFEKSDNTVKNRVYENIAKKKDYKSMEDVRVAFQEQAVLSAIECATLNSEILPVLRENNDYLKIDFSRFDKLKSESTVTKEMRGKKYKTVAEMKEDFSTLVEEALKNQSSGNKGSGGGGGGGSHFGGGLTIPDKTVDLPVTDEVIDEIINKKPDFADIKTAPWAEECIIYLSDKNIINGKSETHFMPLDNVTRAEFVKIISLAFPGEASDGLSHPFKDVDDDAWYAEYVSDAYNRGIIKGVTKDCFGVNEKITRQDIAVILYRIAILNNIKIEKTKSVSFYDEGEISDYAKKAVEAFAEGGIINGNGGNMFIPKGYATRAEAAKLVYCLLISNQQ